MFCLFFLFLRSSQATLSSIIPLRVYYLCVSSYILRRLRNYFSQINRMILSKNLLPHKVLQPLFFTARYLNLLIKSFKMWIQAYQWAKLWVFWMHLNLWSNSRGLIFHNFMRSYYRILGGSSSIWLTATM